MTELQQSLSFWTCVSRDRRVQNYIIFGGVLCVFIPIGPIIGIPLVYVGYMRAKRIQQTFLHGQEVSGKLIGLQLLGFGWKYQYEFKGQTYTQVARYYLRIFSDKKFPLVMRSGHPIHVVVDPASPADGLVKEFFFGQNS